MSSKSAIEKLPDGCTYYPFLGDNSPEWECGVKRNVCSLKKMFSLSSTAYIESIYLNISGNPIKCPLSDGKHKAILSNSLT